MIDERLFYSRTDVCQRSFFVFSFFFFASGASIRSRCWGFVVCHWEPYDFKLNTHSKLKKWMCSANRLLKDVIRASAVSTGLPRTHVWCSGRVCSSFRQSVIRSPAGRFSVRTTDPRVTTAPLPVTVTLQNVLYIRIRWREVLHFRLRRGPLGPILPVESLRAQRHPMSSETQRTY